MGPVRAVVAALITLSVVMAPPAHADDQSYLARLSAYGFTINSETSALALKLGHISCQQLEVGNSSDGVINALYKASPAFTEKQCANIVSVAQMELCPDTEGQ